jgi:hypothetical protein
MIPDEILEAMHKIAAQCAGDVCDSGVLIEPDTGRVASASADRIDAILPPWLRVDRDHDVMSDEQIMVTVDLAAAALHLAKPEAEDA